MTLEELIARIQAREPAALAGLAPAAANRLARALLRELRGAVDELGQSGAQEPLVVPWLGRLHPPHGHARAWRFVLAKELGERASPQVAGAPVAAEVPEVPELPQAPKPAAPLQPEASKADATKPEPVAVATKFGQGPKPGWKPAGAGAEPVLIHPQHKFALIFSPKSACSTAVIWFFQTLGLAAEARAYHEWPHNYRIEKLMRSPEQIAARQLPLEELKIVRVVRDPLDRAGSSFRHALGTGYAQEAIWQQIGVDLRSEGLSFQRFIDFLELEDLSRCNPHHRRQKHPLEAVRPPDYLINASRQDLFAGLNAFEREMGMPRTDFAQLSWIHELQATRVPHSVDMGEAADQLVLTRQQAQRGPWPKGLMTPAARARLEKLYAEDIALYAEAPPLL